MRILVVAPDILLPDSHGGSTHVQELVGGLRRHGEVLLLARDGSDAPDTIGIGQPLRKFPAALRHADAALTLPRALAAARTFAPEVIYERCTAYGLGAMLGLALRIPHLTMVLDQRYSWLSLLRAARLVATRLDIVPAAVRHKATKVSWGANPEVFDAALHGGPARRELGLGSAFVVGYSGSFKPWHGVDLLAEVASRLRDREVRFLLVGDGPGRGELERTVAAQGLADRFVFTGAVPYERVPQLLAAADVCVAPFRPELHGPSRAHGFSLDPLKVFETMAQGKPTITIRADNIAALFDDGEHLLLFEPGRADQLAAAIERLRAQPVFARELAARGRARVLERHTWAAHADQLVGLFGEMLAERRR
jgi:glycosyltransferase involved in cell wall biosynthesis